MIIVAGFKSLYDGHTDLYTKINIPSLHVIGENDEVIHQGSTFLEMKLEYFIVRLLYY